MRNLKNKSVLVTGGAAGIGYYAAKALVSEGCRVIIADINEDALKKAKEKLERNGADVDTYAVDVSSKTRVEKMAAEILEKHGSLDILVNNAGVGHSGELAETDTKTWERLINVNIWGVLNCTYAFLPSMVEARSGHIVNVTSGQCFFRLPTWGAYTTTKLAVAGFSEILHYELRKYRIDVTTMFPFMVNTGFYDDVQADTFGSKMSMKLLPFYSQSPKTVGNTLVKAIKKRKGFEMVSPLNDVGRYSRFVPRLSGLIATVANRFLAKSAEDYDKPA